MLNTNFILFKRVLNSGKNNLNIRNTSTRFINTSLMSFSAVDNIKQKSLVDVAQKELEDLKRSYEPINKSDKEEFLSKNRWVLFENEKENFNYLELKKSQDEYEITIRFTAKPPETPSESRGKGGKIIIT